MLVEDFGDDACLLGVFRGVFGVSAISSMSGCKGSKRVSLWRGADCLASSGFDPTFPLPLKDSLV